MRNFQVLCFFGLLFPSAHSWAAQSGSSVQLRVDVELVTTEVTVVDRAGNPIRNLAKDNFRLYEDGKEQEISNFEEVSDTADGTAQAKTVLIIFDDGGLLSYEIKPARDSAVKFVKEHMGVQDQFAVASFGMSASRVLQNFTNDREKVMAAAGQSAVSVANTNPMYENPAGWPSGRLNAPENALPEKNALPEMPRRLSTPRIGASLDKLASTLGHLRGQKCVLVYTGYTGGTNAWIRDNIWFYFAEPRHDFERELGKWVKQLGHYYVLGFQSGNPKRDGAYHKLEVKTDVRNVRLRYQNFYRDRRPLDSLANSRQEKSLLNAMSSNVSNGEIPITFRASYFYVSPKSAKVIISTKIRTEKLKLRKTQEQYRCVLNIMGAAYGEDGTVAARFSEPLNLTFAKEQESEFRKTNLAYQNQFRLRPGKYRLKLAVSDEEGHVGSMEQSLVLPALTENGLAASSLVIVDKLSPLPDLIRTLHSKLLDDSDPFVYSGMQISPSIENKLPVNLPMTVLLKIYNLPTGSGTWKLEARARLLGANGEELMLATIPLEGRISQTGNSEATVAVDIPFRDVAPGKYKLLIEVSETGTSQSTTAQTDVEFTRN